MKFSPFWIVLVAAVLAISCGPEKSSRDKEQEQIKENLKDRVEVLKPVEGLYKGYLKVNNSGTKFPILFRIRVTTTTVSSGRSEPLEVPTLAGEVEIFDSIQTSHFVDNYLFSTGTYSPESHAISLAGTEAGTTYQFEGTWNDGHLVGEPRTTHKTNIGVIDVFKVD